MNAKLTLSPLISVIIPIYSAEKFLYHAVLSVLNSQGFNANDIELILVDDCGGDNSKGEMIRLANLFPQVVNIFSETNVGPGLARQKGLDIAKGKYVYFLDADDTIDDFLLINLYNSAEVNNADFSGIKRFKMYYDNEYHRTYHNLRGGFWRHVSTHGVIRRDFINNNKICFLGGKFDDTSFCAQLINADPKISLLPKSDGYNIIHSKSHMSITSDTEFTSSAPSVIKGIDQLLTISISTTKGGVYASLGVQEHCLVGVYSLLKNGEIDSEKFKELHNKLSKAFGVKIKLRGLIYCLKVNLLNPFHKVLMVNFLIYILYLLPKKLSLTLFRGRYHL